MQQRFQTTEHAAEQSAASFAGMQTGPASPGAFEAFHSTTETTAETQEPSVRNAAEGAQVETLLIRHRAQSRRHALLGNAAFVLGGGLLFFSLCALFLTLGALHQFSQFPSLSLDFSLTAWGVQSAYVRGGHVTISGLTPLLLLLGAVLCAERVKRSRLHLARQLTQHEDVRVIGPLIEALYLRDRTVCSLVTPHLIRHLGRLRAEDAAVISDQQRWLLRLYLGRSRRNLLWNSDALSLAIIAAFEHIGDGTELPAMRRLAAGKGCIGANDEVQQAAQAYLEKIARRTLHEKQAQTLLRGAEASVTAPDTLLRPTLNTSPAPAEHLLRPSQENDPREQTRHDS